MTLREALKLRSQARNALTRDLETKDPILFTVCESLVCAIDRFVEKTSDDAEFNHRGSGKRRAI